MSSLHRHPQRPKSSRFAFFPFHIPVVNIDNQEVLSDSRVIEGSSQPLQCHRVLDAELEPLMLSKAAQYKLPAEWVSRLARVDPERRQVRSPCWEGRIGTEIRG